jgi:hypothetical protein
LQEKKVSFLRDAHSSGRRVPGMALVKHFALPVLREAPILTEGKR